MRALIPSLLGAVPLALGCASGVSESWPTTDTQVSQAGASSFCSAFAVIERKCVRCHSDPPVNGAPFSLATYEDTQVPSKNGDELRTDRMKRAIESGYMPLTNLRVDPPVEALSCEERATILAWIDEGAPPPESEAGCEDKTPSLAACDEP